MFDKMFISQAGACCCKTKRTIRLTLKEEDNICHCFKRQQLTRALHTHTLNIEKEQDMFVLFPLFFSNL